MSEGRVPMISAPGHRGAMPAVEAAMDSPHIRICQHCSVPYDWRRSPSTSLKMTYCGSFCERADLGFTIETLLREQHFVPASWFHLLAA
jgi:hypothetical protein